ncbi:MAG: hypothetical protein DHS20C16_23280 [Phycisphaerae bacterium]|nr:MAG: hypothetical protein DHS20C16_23280 [Phycisphaerae bacterium]
MTKIKNQGKHLVLACVLLLVTCGCDIKPQAILQDALAAGFNKLLETIGMAAAETIQFGEEEEMEPDPDMVEVSGSITVLDP